MPVINRASHFLLTEAANERRGGGSGREEGQRPGGASTRRMDPASGLPVGARGSGLGGADPDGAEERQRWRRPRRGWARRACPQGFFLFFLFD